LACDHCRSQGYDNICGYKSVGEAILLKRAISQTSGDLKDGGASERERNSRGRAISGTYTVGGEQESRGHYYWLIIKD